MYIPRAAWRDGTARTSLLDATVVRRRPSFLSGRVASAGRQS